MSDVTKEGALLLDSFGTDLLAYLCAVGETEIASRLERRTKLSNAGEEVLAQLVVFATQLESSREGNSPPNGLRLSPLGQFDEQTGTSVGNMLRIHAGGDVDLAVPDDPVTGPLGLLLRDVYPLMLAPVQRAYFPAMHLSGAVWSSPHRKAFEGAVLMDRELAQLFPEETESGGWTGMIYRSTGSGGGVQLWTLPDMLLTNAWWLGKMTGDIDVKTLLGSAAESVDLLRRAVLGQPCEVKGLLAFTGVVLDGVDAIDVPFGRLRGVIEQEKELAPASLEGLVSHTSADGEVVTASYSGDVVLETKVDYQIHIEHGYVDGLTEWPVDQSAMRSLEANVDSVRLGSLLAGDPETPRMLAPTWRMVFDPLSWGPVQGWNDPRQGPSITPRRMVSADASELSSWIEVIHIHRRSTIDVAVRRTISASALRVDPVDALVDLVIAWENLFGSASGESTLRISSSLAWLLGRDAVRREDIRSQASRMYRLRSDIVHGNRHISPQEAHDALIQARSLTHAALRSLFGDRTDVLALTNGAERSRALIMGR